MLPLSPACIGAGTWVRFTFKTKDGNLFYLDQVRINAAQALGTDHAVQPLQVCALGPVGCR